jgi:putative endonuclease
MRVSAALGRFGEDAAVAHLEAAGWQILDRNWRCAHGELDIVARDGATVVFVEVKTRSSVAFGVPADAVGHTKSGRIRRTAAQWLTERRGEHAGQRFDDLRFDVVSVLRTDGGLRIERIEAAF